MASFDVAVPFSICPIRFACYIQVAMVVEQNPPTRTELAVMLAYRGGGHNNYLWFYNLHNPIRNAFDADKSILRASGGGGGRTLEIETFLGPVKWHRAVRREPLGAQKSCAKDSFMYKAVSIRGP